jgi:predicted O-linked N-acetylglucosamine transferase (SPINDLY family)
MALAETDDPEKLGHVVRQFVQRKMPQLPTPLPEPPRWQHHKLRIGYLSADFRWHAVSILMAEVFELHDRSQVEVFGLDYSDPTPSPMRQRVVKAFDHHVMLHQMTDEQAARHIRSLEIDVLIDLTGLTASSRWPILAYKPAPVQVSYLGFPGVSHIPGMTHVMVDRTLMPTEALSSSPETPIWLEVFQANDRQRKIGAMPSRESTGLPQDAVVFCAFNNIFKLTPDVWDVWMRLLKRTPAAVLWMAVGNEATRQRLKQRAQEAGVDPQRLVFANKVMPNVYLARLQCADVFLDTQPFGAGTTASDALWACLPVLTCPGRSYASRIAPSLLTSMGVDELIAPDWAAYEEMAVELGTDKKKLVAVKEKIQQARTQSRLFDTPSFVADLENKLMQACAWRTPAECERSAMAHA